MNHGLDGRGRSDGSGTRGGLWLAGALGIGMLAVTIYGFANLAPETSWGQALAVGGLIGLAVIGGCASIVMVTGRGDGSIAERTNRLLEEQTRLLAQINEHTVLSDGSKRLVYRSKELSLLRSAIEEDIQQGDYGAALTLCTTMAEDFGYREEAEGFRATIENARHEQYDEQVRDAMHLFDDALARRDWPAAHQEAARIRRLFPDAPTVADLDPRIATARDEHKQQLTDRFLQAANHGEVESAMDLLRQLDRYLGKADAERLQEVAHGVVTRHRENLNVQFNIAVRDRNWSEAVRIGNDIIREFPNSKMADEVRSMLEVLQTRASQAAVTAASG